MITSLPCTGKNGKKETNGKETTIVETLLPNNEKHSGKSPHFYINILFLNYYIKTLHYKALCS